MKENCGKIENILNLALDATREEREKSLNLDVGYDVADDSWEVIVKFFGTTEELRQKLLERFPEEQAQIGIYNLTNEYAILRIPQPLVELVASMPEIEYMEKPKRLFFSVENGKRSSCINPLQTGQGTSPTSNLTGKEVLGQSLTPELTMRIRIFATVTERQELLCCGIRRLTRSTSVRRLIWR